MQISEIMDLIDEEKLNELGKLYKIDKVNNKITGKFILKSFVHCILKGYKLSLRALELITNSPYAQVANLYKFCSSSIAA
ncbi:MAG: hypothetical protein QMO91_05420 [Candidatus Tisiphia sp.]|nr:hypothetical protein [Candidatus Tisiphia sp.]